MDRDSIDDYARQISGQKEVISAQGEESLKPYLTTIFTDYFATMI